VERQGYIGKALEGTPFESKPVKCYIAAASVEITVYFGGDMEDFLKRHEIE
jgi:hypothetical protein